MADTLHVFISATSGDLGTVRELVKQGLLTMRCLPVEQANFTPDYRKVAAMLEERIRGCEAVIHLVGLRYGAEPDPASLPAGAPRRSFTQMEADLARRLGKKLYVFLCPVDFPYDPCAPEPEDLSTLQRAYRQEIATRSTLHTAVADRHQVAERIRELQLDLERIREQQARHRRRTLVLTSLFAVALAALGAAVWWNFHRTPALVQAQAKSAAIEAVRQEAAYDPVRIKVNLIRQIQTRAQEEIAKLDAMRDWKQIDEVEKARDQQLADVDRFLEGMGQAYEKNEASANYATASRLMAERGPAEALSFLEAKGGEREKKLEVLQFAKDRAEEVIRKLLREKLLAASLLEKSSQWDQAETDYRAVIRANASWAEPRNALAWLLIQRCHVVDPEEGNRKLREAIDLCRGILATIPREADARSWAVTQNDLGHALWIRSSRAIGAESLRLLDEAVTAFRAALEVRTREQLPQEWAMTQNGLGNALFDQSHFAAGMESQRLLGEAVAAYRAALEVRTREQSPEKWAKTQNKLGMAFFTLGTCADGAESQRLLGESVAAYRAALEVLTREHSPRDWASTQNSLGTVLLFAQGAGADGAENQRLPSESVAAYRASLEVHTRENSPQEWAETQDSLSRALLFQASRAEGAESQRLVGEAVAAARAALEVYTRAQLPQDWALAQIDLGLALSDQGRGAGGAEGQRLLGESVAAFRAALEVFTREQSAQDWANLQINLGFALLEQGTDASGVESRRLLGESVAAFRAALEVHTREQLPQFWRRAKQNLTFALRALAERSARTEAARYRAQADQIDKELAVP